MAKADEELSLDVAVQGFKSFMSQMGKMDGAIGGTAKKWGGLSKIAAGAGKVLAGVAAVGVAAVTAGAVAAAGAVVGLTVAIGKLTLEAAPLEGIGIAFDKMAAKAGLALDDLRDSAAGTVSDFELMKAANVALTGAGDELGKEFGQKLPGLMEIARAAARATGQDAQFMFESLVTGIKRTSPMLIDNTGLQLKMSEANEALAAQLGKTVDELTAEEKQIALLNATLAAGRAMVDDFGGGQLTAAERLQQFQATIQNTKDEIGLAFLPALEALIGPMEEIATGVGARLVEWAQIAGDWLGTQLPRFIEGLSELLSGDFSEAFLNFGAIIKDIFGLEVAVDFVQIGKDIETFADGIVTAVQALQEGDVKVALEEFFEAIGKEPPAGLWKFLDIVGAAGERAGGGIDIFLGAFERIKKLIPTVLENFSKIKDWFATNWPVIQAVALTAWEVIQDVVMAVRDVIVEDVWPSLQEAFLAIEDALAVLGLDWADVWQAIGTAVKVVGIAIAAILVALVGIVTGAINAIAGLIAWGAGIFEDAAAAFKQMMEGLAGMIGSVMAIIKGIFTGDIKLILAGFANWRKSTVDLVVGMMKLIWNAIKLVFGSIKVLTDEFIAGIIAFFKNLYDRLVGGSLVPELMDTMLSIITLGLDLIDLIWTTIWDGIYAFLSAIWDRIVSTVTEKVQAVYTAVHDKIEALKTWWATAWDRVKETLKEAWTAMIAAVKEKAQEVYNAVVDTINSVKDWVSGQVSAFYDMGRDLIQGMVDGILSAIQWLIDAIVNAIQSAIDAAQDVLGMESPSKVFAKIGQNAMAGMALGVSDFAPVVQAQIEAAVMPSAAGGTTNVTNNYNLTTQAITRPGGLRLEFDSMALATR